MSLLVVIGIGILVIFILPGLAKAVGIIEGVLGYIVIAFILGCGALMVMAVVMSWFRH